MLINYILHQILFNEEDDDKEDNEEQINEVDNSFKLLPSEFLILLIAGIMLIFYIITLISTKTNIRV